METVIPLCAGEQVSCPRDLIDMIRSLLRQRCLHLPADDRVQSARLPAFQGQSPDSDSFAPAESLRRCRCGPVKATSSRPAKGWAVYLSGGVDARRARG
jgi:hypothetical protein